MTKVCGSCWVAEVAPVPQLWRAALDTPQNLILLEGTRVSGPESQPGGLLSLARLRQSSVTVHLLPVFHPQAADVFPSGPEAHSTNSRQQQFRL